jgi:phage host-nuclease inhibitor protein Gam
MENKYNTEDFLNIEKLQDIASEANDKIGFFYENNKEHYEEINKIIQFFLTNIQNYTIDNRQHFLLNNKTYITNFFTIYFELLNDNLLQIDKFHKAIDFLSEATNENFVQTDPTKKIEHYIVQTTNNFIKLSDKLNVLQALQEKNILQETYTYWKDKQEYHSKLACRILVLFSILLITSIILALWDETDTLKTISLIKFIKYLLVISLIIWILRILLKIAFSNLHLKEEAHEKSTMIQTYLALIKEGGGLKDHDRKIILEAIFRPSTNGLIKDETNMTLLDILNVFKRK